MKNLICICYCLLTTAMYAHLIASDAAASEPGAFASIYKESNTDRKNYRRCLDFRSYRKAYLEANDVGVTRDAACIEWLEKQQHKASSQKVSSVLLGRSLHNLGQGKIEVSKDMLREFDLLQSKDGHSGFNAQYQILARYLLGDTLTRYYGAEGGNAANDTEISELCDEYRYFEVCHAYTYIAAIYENQPDLAFSSMQWLSAVTADDNALYLQSLFATSEQDIQNSRQARQFATARVNERYAHQSRDRDGKGHRRLEEPPTTISGAERIRSILPVSDSDELGILVEGLIKNRAEMASTRPEPKTAIQRISPNLTETTHIEKFWSHHSTVSLKTVHVAVGQDSAYLRSLATYAETGQQNAGSSYTKNQKQSAIGYIVIGLLSGLDLNIDKSTEMKIKRSSNTTGTRYKVKSLKKDQRFLSEFKTDDDVSHTYRRLVALFNAAKYVKENANTNSFLVFSRLDYEKANWGQSLEGRRVSSRNVAVAGSEVIFIPVADEAELLLPGWMILDATDTIEAIEPLINWK